MNDPDKQTADRIASALRWVAIGLILLAIMLFCAVIRAADELPGRPVATTADAVGWALTDLATLPAEDRPFTRFVWIPPYGDEKWIPTLNFAVNTAASHASTIQLGTPIANGWMMRFDLRRLAPSEAQFTKLRDTWDGLATQDPYFHIPATNTNLAAAVIAPHLSQEQAVALAGLSLSTGGIYRADFLLVKMLSTLEGGKYYDFLQVPEAAKGSTQQATWLATLGVFERTTSNLSAAQRAVLFRSNITGKPRRIDVFHGLLRGGNLVTITHDIGDEDVKAEQHPIRNLLEFRDRAREIIVQRHNGTHAFALTDAQGTFQDSAPDNVARDHTIPVPHTSRLQPAIGCIRCHGPNTDGYQPFSSDALKLLASGVDVFDDLAIEGLTREQVVDQLAGLYAAQLDTPDSALGRARRDYLSTIYRMVGESNPFPEGSIVAHISNHASKVFSDYRYNLVTPEQACIELGLDVDDGQGQAGLKYLMGSQFSVNDPIVAALMHGISVGRSDYESVFVDMALRARSKKQ